MNSCYIIKNLKIAPALVLAPMSGVTCSALRRLIKELNPGKLGLVVSEFISVEGMTRGSKRSTELMKFREIERPFAIQIFGYDVDRMRDAALMVQDHGVDAIDINCGCPAPKVVRRGGGCELMRQPQQLLKIIKEVRKVLSIPLTVKMRSGWDEESKNCLEIAKMLEQEGVDALAIHARTRAQLYRGEANWQLVEQVAEQVKIPVLGSGDVIDLASATQRWSGKISGLFIGRGALANPLVFTEIAEGRTVAYKKEPLQLVNILEKYLNYLREDFHDKVVIGRLKQLAAQMCKGFSWRKDICRAMNIQHQIDIMNMVKDGKYLAQLDRTTSSEDSIIVEAYSA